MLSECRTCLILVSSCRRVDSPPLGRLGITLLRQMTPPMLVCPVLRLKTAVTRCLRPLKLRLVASERTRQNVLLTLVTVLVIVVGLLVLFRSILIWLV